MEHRLEAEVLLSAPTSDRTRLEDTVSKLAQEAIDRTIGRKGEGRLVKCSVKGEKLSLVLESSGARPHQALLAFARRLAEVLGRTEKIGVRSVRAPLYRVTFPLDPPPTDPITLPIPHRLSIAEGTATLELTDLEEEALRDNWVDRAVSLVQEKARRQSYTGKDQFWSLLHQSPPQSHHFDRDPTEEMLQRQWVRNGPTKGKWFLGPPAAHLLRTMERIALEEILRPLGFQEVVQPHHDSFETLLKTGHLEGVPGEFYYVTEPRSRDPADWQKFTDLVAITHKVPTEELAQLVSPPVAVSCYAQCPTIYWWLSGRTIAPQELPLKVFDRAAISNRYESGGRHGLERVDEFHRIEPVYLGTPEQMVRLREQLMEKYARVFNELLELEWRTAWVTPFYMQQSGGVGTEDDPEKVKGTVDFEAYLPYRGSREKTEWLEFQNLSIVGERYTRAFTIRSPKTVLWSGCSGIGLERWLTAFLAQKGLDATGWPKAFREFAGELPGQIRFL